MSESNPANSFSKKDVSKDIKPIDDYDPAAAFGRSAQILKYYKEYGTPEQQKRAGKIWEEETKYLDAAFNAIDKRPDLKYVLEGQGVEQAMNLARALKNKYDDRMMDDILDDALELTETLAKERDSRRLKSASSGFDWTKSKKDHGLLGQASSKSAISK